MPKDPPIEVPKVRDPVQLLQAFLDKEGLTLRATPSFMLRDDGTWSLMTRIEVLPRV